MHIYKDMTFGRSLAGVKLRRQRRNLTAPCANGESKQTMFALKTTIKDEMLKLKAYLEWQYIKRSIEHVHDAFMKEERYNTSKEAWDMNIIHGLQPEYRSFVIAIQGWPAQSSLVEFENLLTSQEAMTEQMDDITLKDEEEALYTSESQSNNKPSTKRGYKNGDKGRSQQGTAQPRRVQKNDNKSSQGKRFEGICYNCVKKS